MNPRDYSPLLCSVLIVGSPASALDISKANNSSDLDTDASWVGGVAPGAGDVAVWDSTFSSGSLRIKNDVSWSGIRADISAVRNVNFSAENLIPVRVSLGADGINNQGGNRDVVITADLLCTADQSWSGGAGLALDRRIAIFGRSNSNNADPTPDPTVAFLDLGGFTVTVDNTEMTVRGGLSLDYSVSNGTFILNNSSLRMSSARAYWFGAVMAPPPTFNVGPNLSIEINSGSELFPWDGGLAGENLIWNADVTLSGGTLHASAWGTQFPGESGTATSNENTLGGTVSVTSPSTIFLSNEIGTPNAGDTLHKITADLSGASSLSIKNHASEESLNYISLGGDNSAFTGPIGIVGTQGIRTVRLTSDTAGSAGATWNIGGANTLELENSAVSLGSLTGAGALTAVGGGASTVSVGGGVFSGSVTEEGGSLLNYHKVGPGSHFVVGTPGWTGQTVVEDGTLTISQPELHQDTTVNIASGAFLNLPHGSPDGVEALVIAGVAQPPGTYGALNSGSQFETAAITGSGQLFVTGPDSYLKWMGGFPSITTDADRLGSVDVDGDQINNFGEFALGGDPTNASDSGYVGMAVDPDLRLVIAVRSGTEFTETDSELVSDPIDGIIYRIQATTDLVNFDEVAVFESFGVDPSIGAPPLAEGWEYRSFDIDLGPDFAERGFARAMIEEAP